MKNALTRKIIAALSALFILTSLAACGNQPAQESVDQPAVSSSTDVSGADVSGSDVSGSDVSASDVVVVDDETASNNVLDAYFAALNSGDADKLVELTYAPPMADFLDGVGLGSDYLLSSFQATIDGMNAVSGGYHIEYEYTVTDADEVDLTAFAAEVDALSKGSGAKVQAMRRYVVSMTAYTAQAAAPVSGGDVSGADVSASDVVLGEKLEESEGVLRLFKFDGVWYVFGD